MERKNLIKSFLCAGLAGGIALSASAQTLLLHYTFDEGSGSALDSGSGTANPGSFEGGAVRSSDAPGGMGFSASFLNDDPYAHVLGGNAAKLNGLTAFTLTTWLNVSEYTSGNHRLMSMQEGGTFGGFSWNMNATPNTGTVGPDNFRLALFVGNNVSTASPNFGSAFSNADVGAHNEWVFLAVTYNAGAVNFYIGDENSSVTALGSAQSTVSVAINAPSARFGVGFTDAAAATDTSVIGLQDDIRVYDGALGVGDLEGVRLANIPEPSTYAAIFGGLALVGAFVYRRRLRK